MATDTERLVISLEASAKKLENELRKARNTVDRQATAIERRFTQMQSRMSQVGAGLSTRLGAVLAGAFSTRELIQYADAHTRAQNALRVTGLEGEKLAATFQQLMTISQANAVPIGDMAQLYSRLSLSAKELNASQQDIIGLTESVALALRTGGSSAEAAAGAIQQLGQAFGGGKVQAEEWNSILDGMPNLARAAAAGLTEAGGSVAELTRLVKSGQISSEAFFRAIQAGSSLLRGEASQATLTFAQQWTRVENALTAAVGAMEESAAIMQTVGRAIDFLVADIAKIPDGLATTIREFERLANAIKTIIDYIQNLKLEARGLEDVAEPLAIRVPPAPRPALDPDRFRTDIPERPRITPVSAKQFPVTGDGDARKRAKDTDDEEKAIRRRTKAIEESIVSFDDFEGIASGALSGFIQDLRQGEVAADALAQAMNRIVDQLLEMASNVAIQQLFKALSGSFQPLGPPMMAGGQTVPGKSYLVGEAGPELFTPGQRGTVTPNRALSQFGSNFEVNVINNAGAQITAQPTQEGGQPRLDVIVDRMIAQKLMTPGAESNRAMRTAFNTRSTITRR